MIRGAIPLFRLAGIQVYLHFTWFIVAILEFTQFSRGYHSPVWGVLEYLGLFGLVTVHEFGHAFACRQTGGRVDRIMLWPLGGVAFVDPPPRPGAYLWSIAAGPLVNVILFPILSVILWLAAGSDLRFTNHDPYRFVLGLWGINAGVLVFNLLPIYPLDGGQLVRGLLWIWLGRIRSLQVASFIGIAGSISLGLFAFYQSSFWVGLLALFIFGQAQLGWRESQRLRLEADTQPAA
jgi:Zn-dependent protease